MASRRLRPNVASVVPVLLRGNRVCSADRLLRRPRTKSISGHLPRSDRRCLDRCQLGSVDGSASRWPACLLRSHSVRCRSPRGSRLPLGRSRTRSRATRATGSSPVDRCEPFLYSACFHAPRNPLIACITRSPSLRTALFQRSHRIRLRGRGAECAVRNQLVYQRVRICPKSDLPANATEFSVFLASGNNFFRIFRPSGGLCGDYLRCIIPAVVTHGGPA